MSDHWSLIHDDKGGCLYITRNNRPARAVEMEGGVIFRFAYDNGEFVGVTLTNLPAVEGRPYETAHKTA